MNETSDLDNNNSIPYGAINWNNEALVSTYAQIEQRDRQRLERDVQMYQHRQQTLPFANVQTRLAPDATNTVVERNDELSVPSNNSNTTFDFPGTDRMTANILNFRPPDNEPQRTFTNRLNGLSHSDTNGYSLQPAPPNIQNVPGAGGAFSGCHINTGMQSSNTERDNFASEPTNSCGLSTRENEKHVKRKNLVDNDDDERGPSRKQFLTEEKMAARMYNLRISSDHSYATNGLPNIPTTSSLGRASRNGRLKQQRASAIRSKQNALGDLDEDEDKNESNRSAPAAATFQFAPGIKPYSSEFGSFLPDEIFKAISQQCFAIVPWKPPLQLTEHFSEEQSHPETTDSRENEKVEEEVITDVDPVMHFEKFTKDSTSFNDDDDCFSLDDDMDL